MAYYRSGTNDFSAIQYENLTADNIKKNITVTVKDPNNQTLKTVTGTFNKSFNMKTDVYDTQEGGGGLWYEKMTVSHITGINSMTFYVASTGLNSFYFYLNGSLVYSGKNVSYTFSNIPNDSTILIQGPPEPVGYGTYLGCYYINLSSFN